jgi:hypothetical protein
MQLCSVILLKVGREMSYLVYEDTIVHGKKKKNKRKKDR